MAGTLAASQDQTLIVFGISPYASNAMMSDNPHSGIYQTDTARTLDHQGGSPACNQGGTAIVQILDARGNGGGGRSARPSRVIIKTASPITQPSSWRSAMKCYRESHYGDYYETEECNSLRACGASCGGAAR